ncbi:hypothetical protein QYE76_049274 [Lolium multiflorum]|uniref:Uncharacterized protein n=1 Tax=Lolium multiflorum TaxID=4521 RepID=A0AAD8SNL8_LOLMU|nr:hypothetical protein QYE76_049274 [Lolium multiflorum]
MRRAAPFDLAGGGWIIGSLDQIDLVRGDNGGEIRRNRGSGETDMASPINFNQFLEKEKLKSNGSNFDWFRHVRIFLAGGNLQYVLDTASLEADLQNRFEHHDPHELVNDLKAIFETHAAVECYEASKHFFSCMMEEGSSVSEHMLTMTEHAKKLSDLGIVIPNTGD